jgi:ABC-2 type transport system ATP-binding protein
MTDTMSENLPPALEIKDLKKSYKTDKGAPVDALKGVTLTVPAGEFFGFLGPNGAGKTSLISIVSGLSVKTSGEVFVNGISIDKDLDKTKSFIGLVPQEFNFNWFETVVNIVVTQAGYYGIPREEALVRTEKILKQLDLWEKRDTPSMSLSGGMKRRLMIARALVHNPKVLLLDEPTAGVDVELRRGMWDFLRELNASGTTIILTTHYLEEAEKLCRRIAVINNGVIIKEGSVKELLSSLNQVTLLLDLKEPVTDAALHLLKDLRITRSEEENTLEIRLQEGETVNDALRKMSAQGAQVVNVRNNGSRLEEVFMNLVEKK